MNILEKIYFRLKVISINKNFPKKRYNCNARNLKELTAILSNIDFSKVKVSKLVTNNITSAKNSKTLEEAIDVLKNIVLTMKAGEKLSIDVYNESTIVETMSLDDFFLTKDGKYSEFEADIKNFASVINKLCELVISNENMDYGVENYNARILIRIFENTNAIVSKLIDVATK